MGRQAPRGIRRRLDQIPRGAREAVRAAPDRDHEDRAGRREQSRYFIAGRQGRYPQARAPLAERSGRVQLFGWVMPREPGHPRIRRDVQGADQDVASPLDRHAGGELQGDRRLLGDTVQRHHRRPLERIGVAYLPQQQEQRGFSRPDLHRQGAVLPPRVRGSTHLSEAPRQFIARWRAVRTWNARDDGAVHRA